MNPSDIPSSSHGFMEAPVAARISIKGRRISARSSAPRSSIHSAKLSRNSSTSRSIKIFADVKDLLGIRGSSHIRPPDHAEIYNSFQSSSMSVHEIESSTGDFDHLIPEESNLIQDDVQIYQDVEAQNPCKAKESPTMITIPESGTRRFTASPDLYESFPRPPAKVLQSHHRVLAQYERLCPELLPLESPAIPESEIREKPSPRIDKLLPPPPYHSFTRQKKLMVTVLVSLAGSLSPMSSTIYFPALNTIATVSLPRSHNLHAH